MYFEVEWGIGRSLIFGPKGKLGFLPFWRTPGWTAMNNSGLQYDVLGTLGD